MGTKRQIKCCYNVILTPSPQGVGAHLLESSDLLLKIDTLQLHGSFQLLLQSLPCGDGSFRLSGSHRHYAPYALRYALF